MQLREMQLQTHELISLAMHIERDEFNSRVSIQDASASALGGMLRISIDESGKTTFRRERELGSDFARTIAPGLILIDTGIRRAAKDVLAFVPPVADLHHEVQRLRAQTTRIEAIIRAGDIRAYGQELTRHWVAKRLYSIGITTPEIDALYDLGMSAGCFGGKLVGAGGGGHFLFAGNEPALSSLRRSASSQGLTCGRVLAEDESGVRVEARIRTT
ncbi:hypothetical protein UNPF46_30915 [Bradyrhizobium sp. UNPF46]|nr:hypothetical protein UNPF46_30915 [Bradyrhizobium sp. UNPF46]